jgi:hypothetical protein
MPNMADFALLPRRPSQGIKCVNLGIFSFVLAKSIT